MSFKQIFAIADNSWESRRDPLQPIANGISVICNVLCGWKRINQRQYSTLGWKLKQEAADYKRKGGLAENERMYFYKSSPIGNGLHFKIKEHSMAYDFDTRDIPCIGPKPRNREGTHYPTTYETMVQSGTLQGVTKTDLQQMLLDLEEN